MAPTSSPTPLDREAAARELLARVHVSATVVSSSLVATSAHADFGVSDGVRLVRVRIVDELRLQVRLETDRDVVFAEPPRLCLVGPYSAPDDAGLSDPCWGEPDLGAVVAAQLAPDGAGHPALRAPQAIVVAAALRRGEVRCDYPPGEWLLETEVDPLVDGSPVGFRELPKLTLEVPFRGAAALPLLSISETRYCGLATPVYLQQGEPAVSSPTPPGG